MNYNSQKFAFKSKQPNHPNSHPNITSNHQTYNLGLLKNEKEKISSDVFYMNPLLIENLSKDELRTHAIFYE